MFVSGDNGRVGASGGAGGRGGQQRHQKQQQQQPTNAELLKQSQGYALLSSDDEEEQGGGGGGGYSSIKVWVVWPVYYPLRCGPCCAVFAHCYCCNPGRHSLVISPNHHPPCDCFVASYIVSCYKSEATVVVDEY